MFVFVKNRNIPLEFLPRLSIDVSKINVYQTTTQPTWMDDIAKYLKSGELPFYKLLACQIRYQLTRFCLLQWTLYKRSFSGPLLRCFLPKETKYIIREIHEGICGNHSGTRSIVRKAIRQRYFWPQMERDAMAFTQKYDTCQRVTPVSHLLPTKMVPMSSPWPFA